MLHSHKELAHWAVDVTREYSQIFHVCQMNCFWSFLVSPYSKEKQPGTVNSDKINIYAEAIWDDDRRWIEVSFLRVYGQGNHYRQSYT